MKSLSLTLVTLALAACGHASPSADSQLADAQPAPNAPLSFIDGLPVIALDPAGFRGAVQGPLLALVHFHQDQPISDQILQIDYAGILPCTPEGLTLGVLQNGIKVNDYRVNGAVIDRSGTFGQCRAQIPLHDLKEGVISFYVYSPAGAYDSDYGRNFPFVLNYANVIPAR